MESPDDATRPLWRAAQAFRAATLLYVVGIQVSSDQLYARPMLSWLLIAVLLAWSGVAIVGFTLRLDRSRLVIADQVIAALLMFSSWLVADPDVWNRHQSLPTTLWVANAVVTMAIWRGPWWGLASGALMGSIAMLVSRDITNLWRDAALPVLMAVGVATGVAAASARRSHERLATAVRLEAATAERERLAREVHDGVLQVLALMQRRGAGTTGDLRELADLAGEQERALRTLLAGSRRTSGDGTQVDLLTQLQGVVPAGVEVSGPAQPVLVADLLAEAFVGAARAAMANATQHAGSTARLFVLVEDLGSDVVVTVRDDGLGTTEERLREAEQGGRMGVSQSIRGRMTEVGGQARLVTAPGEGVEWELQAPREARTPA